MKKTIFNFVLGFILVSFLSSCSLIIEKFSNQVSYIYVQGPHVCIAGSEIKLEAIGYDRKLKKIEKGFCPVWKINEENISLGEFIPPAGRKVIFKAKSKGICYFLVRQGDINITDAIEITETEE